MKELFKLKCSMHRLVNYIFYLIIIVVGIFIGLCLKKSINIDFKNLFNILGGGRFEKIFDIFKSIM